MEKLSVSDPDSGSGCRLSGEPPPDPDPHPSFGNNWNSLYKKMQFFYSCASKEGVQAKGETSSTHKENIQHFKT
jgi:hypothetical protein